MTVKLPEGLLDECIAVDPKSAWDRDTYSKGPVAVTLPSMTALGWDKEVLRALMPVTVIPPKEPLVPSSSWVVHTRTPKTVMDRVSGVTTEVEPDWLAPAKEMKKRISPTLDAIEKMAKEDRIRFHRAGSSPWAGARVTSWPEFEDERLRGKALKSIIVDEFGVVVEKVYRDVAKKLVEEFVRTELDPKLLIPDEKPWKGRASDKLRGSAHKRALARVKPNPLLSKLVARGGWGEVSEKRLNEKGSW